MTTYLQSVRPHIGSQLYLPIVKENAIDRIDIINAMLNAVDDNQLRLVAGRQSESCAPKEIYRLIQTEFQCNSKRQDCLLLRLVIVITPDFGKELPVNVRFLINLCVSQVPVVNQAE